MIFSIIWLIVDGPHSLGVLSPYKLAELSVRSSHSFFCRHLGQARSLRSSPTLDDHRPTWYAGLFVLLWWPMWLILPFSMDLMVSNILIPPSYLRRPSPRPPPPPIPIKHKHAHILTHSHNWDVLGAFSECVPLFSCLILIWWSLLSHQHGIGYMRSPCYGDAMDCLWLLLFLLKLKI